MILRASGFRETSINGSHKQLLGTAGSPLGGTSTPNPMNGGPEHAWMEVHGAAEEQVRERQPRRRSHDVHGLRILPLRSFALLNFAVAVAATAFETWRSSVFECSPRRMQHAALPTGSCACGRCPQSAMPSVVGCPWWVEPGLDDQTKRNEADTETSTRLKSSVCTAARENGRSRGRPGCGRPPRLAAEVKATNKRKKKQASFIFKILINKSVLAQLLSVLLRCPHGCAFPICHHTMTRSKVLINFPQRLQVFPRKHSQISSKSWMNIASNDPCPGAGFQRNVFRAIRSPFVGMTKKGGFGNSSLGICIKLRMTKRPNKRVETPKPKP